MSRPVKQHLVRIRTASGRRVRCPYGLFRNLIESDIMRTEDGHIVYKCLNGDTAAFGLLVDKYKSSIHALAYSKLHNFHDAEDITQETFIKAYQKLRTLRWWDSLLAWLYAIASNLCKQQVRSQSAHPDREFFADQLPGAINRRSMDSYRDQAVSESLHEALDSISDSYRQVLTLYYLGGMSSKEIARFLGTSPNNIAQRLRRARAKLKSEMIATMGETYQKKRLQADFTFRVVEIVKGIKIHSLPRMPWIPWGLSAATGTILAILSFASLPISFDPVRIAPAAPAGLKVKLPPHFSGDIITSTDVPVALMISGSSDQSQAAGQSAEASANGEHGRGSQMERTLSEKAARPVAVPGVQNTVTISGKVVKDNAPVSNAQVHIYARDDLRQETITQADGSFQIEIPKPDDKDWDHFLLTALDPHHSFGWARPSKHNTASIVISLHEPVSIIGTALDDSGNATQTGLNRITGFPLPGLDDPLGGFLSCDPMPVTGIYPGAEFASNHLPEGPGAHFSIMGSKRVKERGFRVQIGTEVFAFESVKPEGLIKGRVILSEAIPTASMRISTRGFFPDVVWTETYADESSYYPGNVPTVNYNVYVSGLANASPGWTARAREFIEITENRTVRSMKRDLFKEVPLVGKAANQDSDHLNAYYRIDLRKPEKSHRDREDERYANSTERRTYATEDRAFSYVDFQFQKNATLIVTVRDNTSDSKGNAIAGAVFANGSQQSKRYNRLYKDGRFTVIGLPAGQRFSLKARQGELQLKGYADPGTEPDAEVEILMEKHKATEIPEHIAKERGGQIPPTNVGMIMYLYANGGRK